MRSIVKYHSMPAQRILSLFAVSYFFLTLCLNQKAMTEDRENDSKNPATVVLLGDSIRMNYQDAVKTALKDKATIWSPKDNCKHTVYFLENLGSWMKGNENAFPFISPAPCFHYFPQPILLPPAYNCLLCASSGQCNMCVLQPGDWWPVTGPVLLGHISTGHWPGTCVTGLH